MNKTICQIGFWSGLVAFVSTIAFCMVQVFQLTGWLKFPADEILIYGTSLFIVVPFLFEMLAFHYLTSGNKRFWSHAALMFSIIYAVFVTANYVVQLATVVPAKLNGMLSKIQILEQTPHSMFWNFDALGYIFMGLATLVAVPVFEKKGFEKWVGVAFLSNAIVTPLIAIVYFSPTFSESLLCLGSVWGVTAPISMLSLALLLKKKATSRA
jgi:hypothetical protein